MFIMHPYYYTLGVFSLHLDKKSNFYFGPILANKTGGYNLRARDCPNNLQFRNPVLSFVSEYKGHYTCYMRSYAEFCLTVANSVDSEHTYLFMNV